MLKKDAQAFLDKVADDEPIFILRAQDVTMVETINAWRRCVNAAADTEATTKWSPSATVTKLREATACQYAVVEWQKTNPTKIPD